MPPRDPVIPATPPNSEISPQDNTSRTYPANVSDVLATQNKSTISIVLTATGDRSTFKFGSDDYNTETLRIAQTYAVGTTSEAKNKYGIDSQLTEGAILGSVITDNNGNPVGISDEAPGSPPAGPVAFINRATAGTIGKSLFVNLSDSGQLDINIIKGKATAANINSRDYDVLLGEINRDNTVQSYGTENDNQLPASVIRTVTLQNSNSPNNIYVPDGQGIPEKQSNVGRIVLPVKLGSYSKIQPTIANGGSQTGNVSAEGNFLANQDLVQSLGSQVTLKSSGEYYVPKNAFNTDEVLLARAATLAPGRARLGIKVPFEEMRASTVLKQNNPDFADFDLPSLKEDEVLSYGSYNNWLNAFNNGNTIASIPGLAIQIGTLATVLVGITALIKPNDDYLDKFKVGFVTFFGLPELPNGEGITGSAEFAASVAQAVLSNRLLKETGWYATILRTINKIIVESTVGTGLTIAGNAGDDIYGASAAGVQGAQNIVEQFYKGSLRGFINDLVIIGTAAVNQNQTNYIESFGGAGTLNKKMASYIDSIDDLSPGANPKNRNSINLSTLVYKNKNKLTYGLAGAKGMTAWGTSTTPSRYILPANIVTAADAITGNSAGQGALNQLSEVGAVSSNVARLSSADVNDLEQKLDSSYMPFYFHDLRTNEIVSFHAFLEDSSDGFNVEWNSQTPYGRVEPIHTYKGTTREINLSFYVVATNQDDRDNMWWKVNKLVTMVYPQYTLGRKITSPDGKTFTQPFSQIPGGSPIVRLRLGELWKTNYSRFNVARTFGLTQGDTNFNIGVAAQFTNQQSEEIVRIVNENTDRIREGNLKAGDKFKLRLSNTTQSQRRLRTAAFGQPGGFAAALDNPDLMSQLMAVGGVGQGTLTKPVVNGGVYTLIVNRVIAGPEANNLICEYEVSFDPVPDEFGRYNRGGNRFFFRCPNPDLSSAWNAFSGEVVSALRTSGIFSDTEKNRIFQTEDVDIALEVKSEIDRIGGIQADIPSLLNSAEEAARSRFPSTGDDTQRAEARQRLQSFFGSSNPIMQAFESNAGQGMAVVFKSLQLDWKNSTWETGWDPQGNNSRAPQVLRITMAGTVIHDITPGIDFAGFNVAPVYQVGRYSNAVSSIDIPNIENSNTTQSVATTAPTTPTSTGI
jgi:hypothetical protein